MNEYDQLRRILDVEFLASPEGWMIEKKDLRLKPQCVKIDDSGKSGISWTLYRFDSENNNQDFLPFFNKSDEAPEGLRKFCDYILLVSVRSKTYVMLIEMKRGDTGMANKQLNAGQTFIEYLYLSAIRLHKDFNDEDFNRDNIKLRKIIVKECKSKKIPTKGVYPIDLKQEFISYNSVGIFPIAHFLEK